MEKQPHNIQDVFLNHLRREKLPVTVFPDERSQVDRPNQELRQVRGHSGIRPTGPTDLQTRHLDRCDNQIGLRRFGPTLVAFRTALTGSKGLRTGAFELKWMSPPRTEKTSYWWDAS